MICLIGASASGKSTTQRILCKKYGYKPLISYTTRPMRKKEKDGIDYHFLTEDEFRELEEAGFFCETAEYNGWHYGTAKKDVRDNTVAVVTPSGFRKLSRLCDNVTSFYIKVSRRNRLIKLLQRNDDVDEAIRRSCSDVGMFDGLEDEVDHVIDNENYDMSAEEIADGINEIVRYK